MRDINKKRIDRKITVYEDNFKIRNSVLKINPSADVFNLVTGVSSKDGYGVIENCILDGGGIFTHPSYHKGKLIIKNCYIRRSPNNGTYADSPAGAIPREQYGGTVHIGNCLYEDNNISHVRLNIGSRVQNTVCRNTGNVPEAKNSRWPNGVINSRGLHTFYGKGDFPYGQPVAKNVHIDVNDQTTNAPPSGGPKSASAFAVDAQGKNAPNPVWKVIDSELRGDIFDKSRYQPQNVGSNPNTTPPKSVPMNDSQALSGSVRAKPGLPKGGLKRGNKGEDGWIGGPVEGGDEGGSTPGASEAGFGPLGAGLALSLAYGAHRATKTQ